MTVKVIEGSAARRGPRPVLTIGNFDGVHLGHLSLLERLVARARALGTTACLYTFDPPPRAIVEPARHPPQILLLDERIERLEEAGVDEIVVERFTPDFARGSAAWFAREIIDRRLRPLEMVVGHDFRFGRRREGDAATLGRLLPELVVEGVGPARVDGEIVSSSRIRELVSAGSVERAALLLGRPHHVRGRVVEGDGRGREIGFPTANLDPDTELLPARGVYAVQVLIGGREHGGVANVGTRPTFDGERLRVEVHVFDLHRDIYGSAIRVAFVARLRDERRFSGPAALARQVALDLGQAREVLGP